MLKTDLFYKKVAHNTSQHIYAPYRALIASLSTEMQQRLLHTLHQGLDLPQAYKILYMGRAFPDKNYERFLSWAVEKWTARLAKEKLFSAV